MSTHASAHLFEQNIHILRDSKLPPRSLEGPCFMAGYPSTIEGPLYHWSCGLLPFLRKEFGHVMQSAAMLSIVSVLLIKFYILVLLCGPSYFLKL